MKVNIGKFPKGPSERKVSVNIDHFDSWNLDHTLALIIYPLLLQLKETKNGVPSEFVNDVGGEDYVDQDSFDFYKESHKESFDEACKRWEEVLEKMIWSFEQLIKQDYTDQYHHGKMDFEWVKTDRTVNNPITGKIEKTFQMVDKNPNEHWYDFEGHQLHEARIQEGLDLFGKHFRSLWD
jgi:hypothetical protein